MPETSGRTGLQVNKRLCRADDFYPGMIITAPHHVTAQKPGADPVNDHRFVQSQYAVICSKRRMFVVMWVHSNAICALPISSHEGNGLRHIPRDEIKYRMPLKMLGDECFVNDSPFHRPLEIAEMYFGSMRAKSSVDLTGITRFALNEEITVVGYTRTSSAEHLLDRGRIIRIKHSVPLGKDKAK